MVYGVFKALIATLSICAICSGAFLHAECPIDTIIVNGHVENASRKGIVKVQLIYPKGRIGESGDVTLEDGRSAARSYRVPGRLVCIHWRIPAICSVEQYCKCRNASRIPELLTCPSLVCSCCPPIARRLAGLLEPLWFEVWICGA